MRQLVKNILRAAFFLPCSAGLVKDRRNVGFSLHDGSIAGVVLLTTFVVIIFEIISVLSIPKSRLLMVALMSLAIISLCLCSLAVSCRSQWKLHRTVKPSDSLKLKFVWLFCLGNVTYQAFHGAMHMICNSLLLEVALYCVFTWVFQIVQTIFIHYFSRFKFANVLCLYYGLLILFVTNISMWTQQTVYRYVLHHSLIPKNSTNSDIPSCANGTAFSRLVTVLEPYLEPVSLEYCLLSLIFISEMWPKGHNQALSNVLEESATVEENNEDDMLLPANSFNSFSQRETESPWNRRSFCVLFLGLSYTFTFIIVECVFIYVKATRHYIIVSYIIFVAGNFIRIPLMIKCFYAFSGELRPKQTPGKLMNMNHFVILTSSFVTCGFYAMESYEHLSFTSLFVDIESIFNVLFRVLATILQTIFILQMNQYQKSGHNTSICSIQNTFLFMCLLNFGLWFSYTFVILQYRHTYQHELNFENVFYPFVVFYHFECFVMFYRLFTEKMYY